MSHEEDNSGSSILRALMIKEAKKDTNTNGTSKLLVPNSLFLSIDRRIYPADREEK